MFFCALGSAQAAANTEANTLIVLDASGSKKNINADCESGSNAPCVRELPAGESVINSPYGADETREGNTTLRTIVAGDNPPVNIDF